MAHELFGTRFLDNRKPAWHRLGQVVTDPHTAQEAFDLVGAYDVVAVPLTLAPNPFGIAMQVNQKALIRTATADSAARVLGVVRDDYAIVGPRQFCQLWDRAIDMPVETLGCLKHGGVIFVSTILGESTINGDPDEAGVDYLLAYNGMDGNSSIRFDVTKIRAVCQNTVTLAQSVASESLVLPHTEKGIAEFALSLQDAFARATHRVAAVNEACAVLVGAAADTDLVDEVLAAAYPLRKRPSDFGPKLIVEQRMRLWETDNTFSLGARDSCKELFYEAPTCNTTSAHGTLWGLYNAVVEFEDYRSHRANPTQAAESSMIGARAGTKERAFASAYKIATS